jgi:hypothetical protein
MNESIIDTMRQHQRFHTTLFDYSEVQSTVDPIGFARDAGRGEQEPTSIRFAAQNSECGGENNKTEPWDQLCLLP